MTNRAARRARRRDVERREGRLIGPADGLYALWLAVATHGGREPRCRACGVEMAPHEPMTFCATRAADGREVAVAVLHSVCALSEGMEVENSVRVHEGVRVH